MAILAARVIIGSDNQGLTVQHLCCNMLYVVNTVMFQLTENIS